MRVLITTFTYAPQANGIAEVVGAQANGLASRGHEVTVATAHDPTRAALSATVNPRLVEFQVGLGRGPGRAVGEDIGRYQEFIGATDADVILSHCWQVWSTDLAIPAFAASRARKVMVSHGFSAHRWVPQPRPPWGLGQWWRARPYVRALPRMLRAFDHAVFLSPTVNRDRFYDRWTLERYGGPPWSVIPNGTWPEKFTAPGPDFRQVHGLGDAFVTLYVGLYTPGKDQERAVRVFHEAGLKNSVLVLIGNEFNDYARRVQREAERLGRIRPGRVVMLEKQSREMIRAAYRAMDVFLMTSRYETQPLVLLDAMACGKPFVSTPVGCVAELPGGVVEGDDRGLADCLRRLSDEPDWRARLAQKGRQIIHSTYHWERVLESYDRLLDGLVNRRNASSVSL